MKAAARVASIALDHRCDGQNRLDRALVARGAISAFVSLVALRVGPPIPLEWTASFSAQVHDAASGPTARVFGRFRQRMAAIDGDLSTYPPEALAALEARLIRGAGQANPGV